MKAKPRRWFVLPSGDDVNSIISRNFSDATFQAEIHVGSEPKSKPAWQVDLETIEQILAFLRTSHIDGKLLIAVAVGESNIRMAERSEYDKKFKRQQKLRSCTRKDIGAKKAPRTRTSD